MTHTNMSTTERAWVAGLTMFAAIMMMIVGVMQALNGIVALANSQFYVVGRNYTWKFDVTAWGWIHLLIGLGVAAVGLFLLMGQTWARWTGVGIVALSALANFAWIPYYPIWGFIVLAADTAIIWALTVGSPQIVE